MKAESTIKPAAPFEIEKVGAFAVVKFYTNIKKVTEEVEGEIIEKFTYEENQVKIPDRQNLHQIIEEDFDSWLTHAKEKETEPKPETDKEKILRLEKENNQLGKELTEREINEMIQGIQISDLEIQLLEIQGGK